MVFRGSFYRNPNARFPRLTYGENKNNNRASTFWLADGSYLRWKSLDISYRIGTNKALRTVGISDMNLQFVGQNLAVWDSVKLWDPGQASKMAPYIRYSVLSLYS